MRKFACAFIVIGLHFAAATSASAQVCSRAKGTYETLGDIVVDKMSKLAWKRCTSGQTWNGTSCTGVAEPYTFKEALSVSSPGADGFAWRIPKPDELASLVISDGSCVPAIDQEVFPRTVPGNYWTGQPLSKNAEMAYCQSFGAGASGSQRQQCWIANQLPVRLVSALPLRSSASAAPTATSFNIDESGTHLTVLGSNFNRTVSHNLVNFPTASGIKPVVPSSGTAVSLTAEIPDDATTGAISVTTNGVTSQPAPGTLRVINNKEGCAAAGLTPGVIPQSTSSWDYCILRSDFKDTPADVLIIGAHPVKLPSTQPFYMLSTTDLARATSARFTLSGRIALQYGSSGSYGMLVVHSNAGQDADTLTTTGTVSNNGAIDNRGHFNNEGSLLNTGNGVILNAGVFTNSAPPENGLTIATTGRAINSVGFSNASGPGWPRAQLKNIGTLATESGSTGIENSHADIINNGTLLLQGAHAFINRSGSAPGTLTNNGSMVLKIWTQPEGTPILTNEPGAMIVNAAGASITNARATWTFSNSGTVQNCGTISGLPPNPNGYAPCPPKTGPDGRIIR